MRVSKGKGNDWRAGAVRTPWGDQREGGQSAQRQLRTEASMGGEGQLGRLSIHSGSLSKTSRQKHVTLSAWTQPSLACSRASLCGTMATSYMRLCKCMLMRI